MEGAPILPTPQALPGWAAQFGAGPTGLGPICGLLSRSHAPYLAPEVGFSISPHAQSLGNGG